MYAYMKENDVEKIIHVADLTNKTFSKFICGQCVEAIILGMIFFIVLTLFQFPYALIINCCYESIASNFIYCCIPNYSTNRK